jgi:hypothetical protein
MEVWLSTHFANTDELEQLSQKAKEDFFSNPNPQKALVSDSKNEKTTNGSNTKITCASSFLIKNHCRYQVTFGE